MKTAADVCRKHLDKKKPKKLGYSNLKDFSEEWIDTGDIIMRIEELESAVRVLSICVFELQNQKEEA